MPAEERFRRFATEREREQADLIGVLKEELTARVAEGDERKEELLGVYRYLVRLQSALIENRD